MLALLLLATLTADTPAIPGEIRDYFQRSDEAKASVLSQLETRIEQLEIKFKGEPIRTKKGSIRAEIHKLEKALADAKATPATTNMSKFPKPNEVGMLTSATIAAIVDDDTAIITAPGGVVIVIKTPTKHLKIRRPFASTDTWQVSGENTDQIRLAVKTTAAGYPYYIATPLPAKDIAAYRKTYDALQ